MLCVPVTAAVLSWCSQVTPESLLLHYFSNRPGLWPIVVGVLKGMSNDYFKLDLKVGFKHYILCNIVKIQIQHIYSKYSNLK